MILRGAPSERGDDIVAGAFARRRKRDLCAVRGPTRKDVVFRGVGRQIHRRPAQLRDPDVSIVAVCHATVPSGDHEETAPPPVPTSTAAGW